MDSLFLNKICRHPFTDRTPKQKLKMVVNDPKFYAIFEKYDGPKKGNIKLKASFQLQEVLDVAREILENQQLEKSLERKYEQLKSVLEMHGQFLGVNRKVQLKSYPKKANHIQIILKWGGEITPGMCPKLLSKQYL